MVAQQVLESVREGGLLAPDDRTPVRDGGRVGGRPILVMLSGGRDSTCLLDVAVALLGADAVSALHVNYGLREQAGDDERHCAAFCRQLGVELHVVHADPRQAPGAPATRQPGDRDAARSGAAPGNLHAWARELRYAEANRLAERSDALIATGHTASDQLETILYRLAASPGRRALLGMVAGEGRLIRPLLGVSREHTAAYCRERGLRWREDASNDDPQYARARVRGSLVPALRSIHPAAEGNVLRTAALLREETELLERLVDDELAGAAGVSVERLRELPAALARMVVVRLAEDATGSYVPQAGDRVQEILALAGRSPIGRGGRAELHVGGQAGAVIEDGRLTMVRLAPRA